jgi:bla regulator protein BlaR1
METLLEIGLVNALMATGLALVVAVVGRCCRRPAVMHLLWILVLLKLMTPPALWVPLSWPESLSGSQIDSRTIDPDPPLAGNEPSAEDTLALLLQDTQACTDLLDAAPEENVPAPSSEEVAPARPTVTAGQTAVAMLPTEWMADHWAACMFFTWLAGSVAWLATGAVRIHRFHRLLRFGKPAPAGLQEEAQALARRLGLQHCPLLWVVPGKVSPLLWAVGGRARLILPAQLLAQLRPDQRSTLFAHELAHARRRDHWVRWLELAATSLYWWHPVAWWARHEIQQAEEQCCDAWVVQLLPQAAKAYAKALLQTVDFLDARPALPPVASGIGHVHLLKRRLMMIVREPLSPKVPWPLQVGALCLGLLVLPFAPQRLEANNSQNDASVAVTEANVPASTPAFDDEESSETPRATGSQRDLERRMQRLEERMDRLMRALESRGRDTTGARSSGSDEESKAKDQEKRAKDLAKQAQKRAEEQAKMAEKRAADQARRAQERARAAEARAKDRTKDDEKAKTEGSKESRRSTETRNRIVIDSNIDPERMKRIEKQIHEAIHQAFDPERVKRLEQQIQKTVDENLSPERMKRLQQQIESAINPQRMEAMARRIEEAVNQSLSAEQQERVRRRQEERTAESAKTPSPRSRGATTAPQNRDQRDLERRIEKLEQKLDKLIDSLQRKSGQ